MGAHPGGADEGGGVGDERGADALDGIEENDTGESGCRRRVVFDQLARHPGDRAGARRVAGEREAVGEVVERDAGGLGGGLGRLEQADAGVVPVGEEAGEVGEEALIVHGAAGGARRQ